MFTSEDTTIVPDSNGVVIPIDKIVVADRYRKDLGDVSGLKSSIANIGLLNPITVQEYYGGYKLIAGERRLRSHMELGLAEIPARIARDIADARDALVAERDENTERKEMLPSEKTALGMAIEEMEKPAALERQREAGALYGRGQDSSGSRDPNLLGKQEIRPRDVAAEAVGLGEPTYRRIKTVMNLAEDDTQPEEVQEAAKAAVEIIDAGGSVRSEYDRVKEVRRKSESVTVETEPTEKGNDETKRWHKELAKKYLAASVAFAKEGHTRHASAHSFASAARYHGIKYRMDEREYVRHSTQSQEWLERSSTNVEVALDVLGHIDFSTITPELAEEALQRLDVTRQLGLYIRSLKEITNG